MREATIIKVVERMIATERLKVLEMAQRAGGSKVVERMIATERLKVRNLRCPSPVSRSGRAHDRDRAIERLCSFNEYAILL